MKACPKCSTYCQDSYFVCTQCGAELGKGADGAYGRGFLALLSSRLGIRLILMAGGAIVLFVWFVIYGLTH